MASVQDGVPLPSAAAWFGSTTGMGDDSPFTDPITELGAHQDYVGRKFALVRIYHAWDEAFPSDYEYWLKDQGQVPVMSWNASLSDRVDYVKWADIAAGTQDATIDARAADVKAYGSQVYLTFHHEPEPKQGSPDYGTPADFVAAWQHIHDRFAADGVTNVVWVLILLNTTYGSGGADDYYPGDSYVDILGVDGYNWYGCTDHPGADWQSFSDVFTGFYGYGELKGKPMFVTEYGSGEDPLDPNRKAQWFTDELATLKTWPDIKAVLYYDHNEDDSCVFWVGSSQAALDSYQALGADPYLNPPPPLVWITSGPADPTNSTTATFAYSVSGSEPTTSTCKLDSLPAGPCDPGVLGTPASDGFNRTVSNGWGTADSGGTWSWAGGVASDYAVNGSAGTMRIPTTNEARLAYLSSNGLDNDFLVRFMVDRKPTTLRINAYVVGRYDVGTGAFYSMRGSLVWDGTMRLQATKKPPVGIEVPLGTESNLGAIGAGNTWYWMRAHIGNEGNGVRLEGSLWKDGSPEPSNWQFSYLDTSAPIMTPGRSGLRAAPWATDVPFTVSFDDLSITSGVTYTGLSDGAHTLLITSTDDLGNAGTATWDWTVDATPPVATITAGPKNPTNATSATFKFSSNELGSTFTCQLDTGTAGACTSPTTYNGLADGPHTFTLTATDPVGNVSAPAVWTWTIDTVAPSVTITSGPPTLYNRKSATFTFTSDDPLAIFACSRDGGMYFLCTAPKTYWNFTDGPHTVSVEAIDQAGNVSAPANWTWTVDTVKPVVTITSGPPNPDTNKSPTFTFTSDDPNVVFTCTLDSGTPVTCTSPKTYTNLQTGSHTFSVYATDQAGNVSVTSKWAWKII